MKKQPVFKIGNRVIQDSSETYVIAELSANHNHDFEHTIRLIEEAKKCGADAVKVQTYTADTLTFPSSSEIFRIGGGTLWDGTTLYDLYKKAYMPWEWQPKLKEIAAKIGIDFFSAAFDATAVDFLEKMGVAVHKIASPEITDLPLVKKMALTGKPLIISTGMATFEEVEQAAKTFRQLSKADLALLKCNSSYPAPSEDMNLLSIPDMMKSFDCVIGLSDHTLTTIVPTIAVALGARIVEKHFTISREMETPDSKFSLEPHEFKEMVDDIHLTKKILGKISYGPTQEEQKTLKFRRSLFVVETMKKGETFSAKNLRSLRPANGLSPGLYEEILGKTATQDIEQGTPLSLEMIQK